MSFRTNRRFSLLAILTLGFALCGAASLHAETPAPPPVAPTAPVAAAVPTVPAPAPVAPVASTAEAPQRREEENPQAAAVPTTPGIATRVSSALNALRGQGAVVQQLADRDRTIADLRTQLGTAQSSLQTVTADRDGLRSELAHIESAMRGLESERRDVITTVASMGFDATRLPAQQNEAAPEKKAWEISSRDANAAALKSLGFGGTGNN